MRFWPSVVAALVVAGSLAVALPAVRAQGEGRLVYPLDDTYIHMGMAKHLATHGVWGVTRYQFSSSSSSPLWTLTLAAAYAATGVHDVTPLVLNLVFAVLLLVAGDRWLARLSVPALPRAVVLVGLVLATQLPALILMGMEHVLHLFLTVWFADRAIAILVAPDRTTPGERVMLCVSGALLGASRYEGLFLVAIVCVLLVCRRRPGLGVGLGAAAVAPLVALGLVAIANGSLFVPNSLLLKAGGEQLSGLTVLFRPPGTADLELFGRNPALSIVLVAAVIAGAIALARLRTPWQPPVLAPLMLAVMIALHAHFAFSSLFWVYRYDAYLAGFGVIAIAIAVAAARLGTLPLAAGLAVFISAVASPAQALYPDATIRGARENFLEHYGAADFVNRYYPAGPVVVNDIGAFSYFGDARFFDLFGLGDIDPLVIRRANAGRYTAADVDRWTAPHHPSAAILQLSWAFVVERVPPNWLKVAEVTVVSNGQLIGFFAMTPDSALALRERVREYYGPLAGADRYSVRIF